LELAVLAVRGGSTTRFGGRGRVRWHWHPPSTHSTALAALGWPIGCGSGALVAGSGVLPASSGGNTVWMRRRHDRVLFTGSDGLPARSGSVDSCCHLKEKVWWASASGCVWSWCWSDVEGSSSATLVQGRGQQRKACGSHGDCGAGSLVWWY
jgi:hypothetical protein